MEDAQLHKPIIFVLLTIISVLILLLGYSFIAQLTKTTDKRQIANFVVSLQSSVKKYASGPFGSYGTVKEESLSLPNTVQAVCFVDREKAIEPFANSALAAKIDTFKDDNIFFIPFEEHGSYKLSYIEVGENPLCLRARNGKLEMKLESRGGKVALSPKEEHDRQQDCVSVLYSNDPDKAIDMVFLPFGYRDAAAFSSEVNRYVNLVLLDTEPFKSSRDKFNFFRIDNFNDDLGCEIKSWISCDEFKAKIIASSCPNDYIVILVERGKIADLLKPVRSSAIGNMVKVNTADNSNVLPHELGHGIGSLADEYVDDDYYSSINFKEEDYPNCDDAACNEWGDINGTSCYKGCSLSNYYRPTKDSLMRTLQVDYFGPVNDAALQSGLNLYGD